MPKINCKMAQDAAEVRRDAQPADRTVSVLRKAIVSGRVKNPDGQKVLLVDLAMRGPLFHLRGF